MKHLPLSRRTFVKSTSALGMLSVMPGLGLPSVVMADEHGSSLKLRFDNDNDILDPGYMTGGVEIETQKQCLPFLAQYVTKEGVFTWEPTYFVTRLEQRDDNHIDFTLADNLVWTDGYGPVRASDVKYSYERMKGTDWSGYFDAMDHVEVSDDLSGTIVLTQPFAPFIMVTLCHGPAAVLCEQAMKDKGEKFTTEFPAICGPYLYEQIPGQKAVFTPNPDWAGTKPDYERVEASIINEAKAAELAFEAGEIACTEINADTLARYQESMPENTGITVAGELQYMWLGMNTEHPKLKDKTVRRAIQHAVDVDSILQGAYSGTTAMSHGIICPGLIGQREDTKYYHYDTEKAKALLDEAGVSGLELTLKTLNNQERMLTAQIIQANLGAVGINVKVLPQDSGPFWEMGQESKGDGWKDLEMWIMRFGTVPDPYEATQWFVSDQIGVWNWERWSDEEFDRLYLEGTAETDPQKRHDIYVQMQEIMEETGAYVWINHEPEAFVHRADVEVRAAPTGDLNYRLFRQL